MIVDTMMAEHGWILVSVPAYQSLFTSHDTALKHYRRYSPVQCANCCAPPVSPSRPRERCSTRCWPSGPSRR